MTSIWCDPGITKPAQFLENWPLTIFLLDPKHIEAVSAKGKDVGANMGPVASVTGNAEGSTLTW